MRCVWVVVALATAGVGSLAAAQSPNGKGKQISAVLTGIIKDEYGDPLADAEVRIESGGYGMRTDTSGKFRIEAPAGFYNVIFRRLGYEAADFSWRARAGEETGVSIRLDPVPHALDTVVVRDRHDRVAGASSIGGVVVDSATHPIPGVELQLVGTGRRATSYEDGVFFFSGLAQGDYVVRARRMGFTPVNLTVKVGKGELHDIAIRLAALPHTLATVEVTEKSGFGQSAIAWQEFDRRQRWKAGNTATVSRDELARTGKTTLDWALRGTSAMSLVNMPGWVGHSRTTSIVGSVPQDPASPFPGDVCVLVDGLLGERRPLNSFTAEAVERVEVYAPDSDWTGTIGSHMNMVKGCEPVGSHHPSYFVVWMRGGT